MPRQLNHRETICNASVIPNWFLQQQAMPCQFGQDEGKAPDSQDYMVVFQRCVGSLGDEDVVSVLFVLVALRYLDLRNFVMTSYEV